MVQHVLLHVLNMRIHQADALPATLASVFEEKHSFVLVCQNFQKHISYVKSTYILRDTSRFSADPLVIPFTLFGACMINRFQNNNFGKILDQPCAVSLLL